MTNNEILARWADHIKIPDDNDYYNRSFKKYPDYPNDAAACDSLLDTLVEKGYAVNFDINRNGVLTYLWNPDGERIRSSHENNIRAAIVAACLEVARKELENVES